MEVTNIPDFAHFTQPLTEQNMPITSNVAVNSQELWNKGKTLGIESLTQQECCLHLFFLQSPWFYASMPIDLFNRLTDQRERQVNSTVFFFVFKLVFHM